jgi:hypothetical protein
MGLLGQGSRQAALPENPPPVVHISSVNRGFAPSPVAPGKLERHNPRQSNNPGFLYETPPVNAVVPTRSLHPSELGRPLPRPGAVALPLSGAAT